MGVRGKKNKVQTHLSVFHFPTFNRSVEEQIKQICGSQHHCWVLVHISTAGFHLIKKRHYQVSKDFSFSTYSMHKLALADKFQAIKYMNQCPDFEIWVEVGSDSSSYEKTKAPYSMSFREQRCVSKGNAV